MKKSVILTLIAVILIIASTIFLLTKKSNTTAPDVTDNTEIDLPINTLPLEERPFITLAPIAGRSLEMKVSGAPKEGELEYEMIYSASGKQEGAIGSIFLDTEVQPIAKSILLGSKSGGGKITYHEGVTGGSVTVTYGETRLKESWNYLRFDPTDPVISSVDGRFIVTLTATALKKDTILTTMKTFGYEKAGLPDNAKVIAGPYSYYPETPAKGTATVEIKLPAGEHVNPTLYGWDGKTWSKVVSKLTGDSVTASSTNNVFVVTAQ